jgi:hypothetical protein
MEKTEPTLKIRDDVVLRRETDGAFLFDPENGRLCYLNPIGIDIWNMCRQPVTAEHISGCLAEQYPEESREKIAADCRFFLSELQRLGFVVG